MPSADAACDPGWMLPLALFSLAYSAFIMTGGARLRAACCARPARNPQRGASRGWGFKQTVPAPRWAPSPCAAGDDELYTAQRPLPLAELHSGRPGGVLALLKMALWHVLWVEAPPSPGGRAGQPGCERVLWMPLPVPGGLHTQGVRELTLSFPTRLQAAGPPRPPRSDRSSRRQQVRVALLVQAREPRWPGPALLSTA